MKQLKYLLTLTLVFPVLAALADPPPVPGSYAGKVPTAYQHNNSPFSASVGICQETENQTQSQLNTIASNFKMIHIYKLDVETLQFAQNNNMEVLLGTTTDRANNFGDPAKGLSNATDYVKLIKPYANVIKAICLGNEPNISSTYIDETTFPVAAKNLAAALSNASLNIPVTANLVFGCTTSYYPPSAVNFAASGTVDGNGIHSPIPYINAIVAVNPKPFIFFDLYPHYVYNASPSNLDYCLFKAGSGDPSVQCCGMFDAQYLSACNATYAVNPNIEIYVAETGWPNSNFPTIGTPQNQAAYINNFYKVWVDPQGSSIPVFLFYAYPNRADNQEFALFTNTGINFSQYKTENGK